MQVNMKAKRRQEARETGRALRLERQQREQQVVELHRAATKTQHQLSRRELAANM